MAEMTLEQQQALALARARRRRAEEMGAPSEVPGARAQPSRVAEGFSPFKGDPLRGLGLGARDVVAGLATIPGIIYDVAAAPFNLAGANIPSASSQVQRGLTAIGLPEPRTPQERLVGAAVRGGAVIPVPGLPALSGAAAEVTGEVFRQSDTPEIFSVFGEYGPQVYQTLGSLGSLGVGLATGSPRETAAALSKISPAAFVAKKAAPAVKRALEPFTAAGKEAIRGRTYAQLLGNDPARIQQAIDLLNEGRSVEDVALTLDSPQLAAAFKQVTPRSPEVANELFLRNKATQEAQTNQLAAAQQTLQQLEAQQRASSAQQLSQIQTDLQAALDVAETAQRQVGAAVPRARQMEVGKQVTASREKLLAAAKAETGQLYKSAIESAGDTKFTIGNLISRAKTQAASTEAALDPRVAPNTSEILARFKGKETVSTASPFTGVAGEGVRTVTPPQVSMQDADEIMQAINRDLSALSGSFDSTANVTRRNLTQLKTALKEDMGVGVPAETYGAYLKAQQAFMNRVDRPFRRGWVANLERQSATGEQLLPPSKITAEILKNEENASRFISSFSDDQKALDAVKNGVVDAYRKAVVRNGKVDAAAHGRFLDKYNDQLDVLDSAGLGLRQQFEKISGKAADIRERAALAPEAAAAKTAAVTKQQEEALGEINRVQRALTNAAGRVGVTENRLAQSAALDERLKTLPDVRAAIDQVKAQIETAESFDDLAKAGGKSTQDLTTLASKVIPTGPQWLSTLASAIYNVIRGTRAKIDDQLVELIARDMINSPEIARLLEKSRVKEAAKAKAPVAGGPKNNLARGAAGAAAYSQDNQNALAQ